MQAALIEPVTFLSGVRCPKVRFSGVGFSSGVFFVLSVADAEVCLKPLDVAITDSANGKNADQSKRNLSVSQKRHIVL